MATSEHKNTDSTDPDSSESPYNPALTQRKIPERWGLLASLLVIVVATGLLIWAYRDVAEEAPASSVPTIAVLPFDNLSGDPQQDYFSDGLSADLISSLSQLSGLRVIARNSVFAYKDSDADAHTIGKELGASYIVEGSIRKAGDRLRITASLLNIANSEILWAERFDGALDKVFELQDTVTSRIVSSLEIRLSDSESSQLARKYTDSIEAYDLFLRGWQQLWAQSKDSNQLAQDYFLRALNLDKKFARAWANLATSYAYEAMYGWSDNPSESLGKALRFAHQAITLDPEIPQVHWAKGLALAFDRQYDLALAAAQQAINLDPNFADGYGLVAMILNYAGKPEAARSEMLKAMQLNPRHPAAYQSTLGEIFFNLRDYAEAIKNFELALDRNPEAYEPRLWLVAALAHAGRTDEASWQLEQLHNANSSVSLALVEEMIPFRDPDQRQRLIDGLAMAGLE